MIRFEKAKQAKKFFHSISSELVVKYIAVGIGRTWTTTPTTATVQ